MVLARRWDGVAIAATVLSTLAASDNPPVVPDLRQSPPMSRVLVLCFVLLLPYQFAWSVAASYCEHETESRQTQHFGHHQHAHQGATDQSGGKLAADNDCGVCHGGAFAIESDVARCPTSCSAEAAAARRPAPLGSALARAPDRPQWRRLA